MLIALSLLMNTILPQPRSFMPDKYMRLRRTPLSTFNSKNLRQSSSGICSNGFGSKMPRLFTRISTDGNFVPSSGRADLLHAVLVSRRAEFVPEVPGRQLLGVGDVAGHIEGKPGQHDKARKFPV